MVEIIGEKEITGHLKISPGSAPTAAKGVIYYDSGDDKAKISVDGSGWVAM